MGPDAIALVPILKSAPERSPSKKGIDQVTGDGSARQDRAAVKQAEKRLMV
jgi:hypothetical protein